MWLNNLHLRSARPASNPLFYLMISCVTDAAKMWLTNCTFQGDGVGRSGVRGFGLASGCRVYMSGAPPHALHVVSCMVPHPSSFALD